MIAKVKKMLCAKSQQFSLKTMQAAHLAREFL
jgi:hypothetical protein